MGSTLATGADLNAFCSNLGAAAASYPACAGSVQPNVGPVSFTDNLELQVAGPGIGQGAGQCPMLPNGACTDLAAPNAAPVNCTIYRECDPYTGAQHPGYVTAGTGNPYSWSQDGNGNWIWYGGDGLPATPPNWATPPSATPSVSTVGEFNPNVQSQLAAISAPGMTYNPSSGWTPAAGSAPTDTSPSIPAFVNTPGNAQGGPSAGPGGLSAVFGGGGSASAPSSPAPKPASGATAPSVTAAAPPAGSPGTSGVITPVVTTPKNNGWLLIAAAVLFIVLASK